MTESKNLERFKNLQSIDVEVERTGEWKDVKFVSSMEDAYRMLDMFESDGWDFRNIDHRIADTDDDLWTTTCRLERPL